MDQNNMGGFVAMPGQNPGFGNNDASAAMPNGVQAAPAAAPGVGAAPNTMPGVNPMAQPQMMPGAVAQAQATDKKANSALVETIVLVVVCLIAAAAIVFAVIFFMQYSDLNSRFETEVATATANAETAQREEDLASFEEEKKLPYSKFTGPSDYGSIGFEFPKTWSVYVASDGSNNSDFVSYFRPSQVDPIESESSRYALRFSILNQQINNVQQEYESKVDDGSLTSSVFNADNNKISGTRYTGKIAEKIDGILVIFKVNDKTVIMQTDSAAVYQKDFDTIISKLRRNS
jgi:hypothetical protein